MQCAICGHDVQDCCCLSNWDAQASERFYDNIAAAAREIGLNEWQTDKLYREAVVHVRVNYGRDDILLVHDK